MKNCNLVQIWRQRVEGTGRIRARVPRLWRHGPISWWVGTDIDNAAMEIVGHGRPSWNSVSRQGVGEAAHVFDWMSAWHLLAERHAENHWSSHSQFKISFWKLVELFIGLDRCTTVPSTTEMLCSFWLVNLIAIKFEFHVHFECCCCWIYLASRAEFWPFGPRLTFNRLGKWSVTRGIASIILVLHSVNLLFRLRWGGWGEEEEEEEEEEDLCNGFTLITFRVAST